MAEIDKGLPNTRTKIDIPSEEEMAEEVSVQEEEAQQKGPVEVTPEEDGGATIDYYRSRYHVWLSRYVGGLSRNSHDATICAYDPRHHSQLTATQPNKWCYRRKA